MKAQTAVSRLRQELRSLSKSPPDHIITRPLPSNILVWYFILEGPPDSPYAGGTFLGRLSFPSSYPYAPPAVYMLSPQGRFKVDTKLCLSGSDFHPELWSPAWSVGAVLTGLLTFMLMDEVTVGSIKTSEHTKIVLASSSHAWIGRSEIFAELFPEFLEREATAAANAVSAGGKASIAKSAAMVKEEKKTTAKRSHEEMQVARLGRDESDKECLLSMVAWISFFAAIIFYIFRLLFQPA